MRIPILVVLLTLLGFSFGDESLIITSPTNPNEQFGASLTATGSLVFVGAPYYHNNTGAVYIYDCSNPSSCAQISTLGLSSPQTGDVFGLEMANSGFNRVAISAPGRNNKGTVFMYDCTTPNDCTSFSVISNDAIPGDMFGYAVALSGSTLVATTVWHGGSGAAYVFSCSSSSCIQGSFLNASDGIHGMAFGSEVAISSNLLLVSAYYTESVYVYFCENYNSCIEKSKLQAPTRSMGQLFGLSLAISGSNVAIGAPLDNVKTGTVYLYDCSNPSSCDPKNQLYATDGNQNDFFGASVLFLSSTKILVSATGLVYGEGRPGGIIEFTCQSQATCVETSRLFTSDFEEEFPTTMALSSKILAASNVQANLFTGNVYIFSTTGCNLGCPSGSIGDSICDLNCFNSACNFDGGDCALCENNGFYSDGCSCPSGFTGQHCETNAGAISGCPRAPTVAAMNTSVVAELNNYVVTNGHFTFDIESHATSDRFFSDVSISGNASCAYPKELGHFFSKSFLNAPDCMDVISGNFTIPELVGCGFLSEDRSSEFVVFGGIHVTGIDLIGTFRQRQLYRNTKSVLSVEITIPTSFSVTTAQNLTVFSEIAPEFAVTSQVFNQLVDEITIVITSSVQWPYRLRNVDMDNNNHFGDGVTYLLNNELGCASNGGVCYQNTVLTFQDVVSLNKCDRSGIYNFTWTYGCRSGQNPCPVDGSGEVHAEVELQISNPCPVVRVAAHIAGSLQSYPDGEFQSSQLVFVIGQPIFFLADFTSDITIQSVTLVDLYVSQPSRPDSYLVLGGNVTVLGSFVGYTPDTPPSQLGDEFAFHFLALTGTLGTHLFDPDAVDATYQFSVSATFEVTYKTVIGRRKRNTELQSLTLTQEMALHLPRHSNGEEEADINLASPNAAGTITISTFGFCLLSALMAIVMIFLE